jgi:hypothetical protein
MIAPSFRSLSTSAWRWPWTPQPRIAAVRQPSGAQRLMQTPLATAVRVAVISAASITALGIPVSGSLSTMSPFR